MDYDINYLTTAKEGQYFDRKSARIKPEDILKELVGFANASGGVLAIGIEDDGLVTGFGYNGAKEMAQFIEAPRLLLRKAPIAYSHQVIPTTNDKGALDSVLLFDVQPATNHIIESHDGEAYLRVNDKTIRLSYEQRKALEYDKGQRFFEDEEVDGSSLDDVDSELMHQYKVKMGAEASTAGEILSARNMLRRGQLTNAGVLLFAKHPTKYLPNARVKFLRYEGTVPQTGSGFNVVKEVTIEGPIPQMIEMIKDTVNMQLREFQYLDSATGKFLAMPEYPEFAWFEGAVNALMHRDYAMRGDYIRVSMYDDHLEIFSPGKLPNIVTLKNMTHTRYSRNPRIARVLSEFGWVKELNEGVRRIYSEMERCFLGKPRYSEPNDNSVQLVLSNNILNRNLRLTEKMRDMVSSDMFKTLSEEEKSVCQYAFATGRITLKDAAALLNRSKPYSTKLLKKLTKAQLLRWHGSSPNDPTQYYTFGDLG